MLKRHLISDEEQFEEVLFTFLRHLDKEKKEKHLRIKERFIEYLSSFKNDKAVEIVRLMQDKDKSDDNTSPLIGTVIEKVLDIRNQSIQDLTYSLEMEQDSLLQLMKEGVRLTETNIKDVVETLAYRFAIKNPLAFRELLGKGIKYFNVSLQKTQFYKTAARKKK
jgi:hypothetical protein